MAPGRTLLLICFLLLLGGGPRAAQAGWWFGQSSDGETSGLDLEQGYDQNTVVTVTGTVIRLDEGTGQGPLLAVFQTPSETLSLVLGPRSFWQERGLPLQPGDQVSVRGSKAQGRDGVVYLLVQSFTRAANGEETALRSRSGRPVWPGGNRPEHQRPAPMRQQRGGRNH